MLLPLDSLSKKIIHLLHKKSILWKLLFIYFLSFCSFESIQGNIMYYTFFPLPITINRYCRCSCSRVQSTLCSNFMMVTSLFAPIHLGLRVPCSLSRIASTFLQRAMKRLERALATTIGMSGGWILPYGSRWFKNCWKQIEVGIIPCRENCLLWEECSNFRGNWFSGYIAASFLETYSR